MLHARAGTPLARAPGPFAIPVVGGMLQLGRDPLPRIRALRARFGGFVRLGQLGRRDVYLVTDPSAVRHVLLDHHPNYKKGLASRRLRPVLGDGSLLLEGAAWRQRRRLIQPAFHKQKVASLAGSFVAAADAMIARWEPAMAAGHALDARDEMLALTMGLTVRNMFGADTAELQPLIDAWRLIYDDLSRRRLELVRRPAWVPDPRRDAVAAAMATVRRVLSDFIARARAADAHDDTVLAMLVAARDADDDARLSESELRDEIMTIFVGGYETSSNALAFALASLAADPTLAARHRAEVAAVLGDRAPGVPDLAALPLNRAILDETLRRYPPSWMITREAIEDDVVAGYRVAAGSQLLLSSYGVHHAPELWDAPDEFRPDRFVARDAAPPARLRFAYFPFGGGPRICLGDQYALTEMQLVLARLAQQVTLALAPGCRIEAAAHVGLRPRHPLRILARRLQSRPSGAAT